MKPWIAIFWCVAASALGAGAARPAEGPATSDHFPQPIRVADLIGQKLIAPSESQPLLGHVEAVDRGADGAETLRVRTWSLLPWGGRSVEVPLDAVSFLGPQVALTGLTEAQLEVLPSPTASSQLAPDQTIRMNVVKPFH